MNKRVGQRNHWGRDWTDTECGSFDRSKAGRQPRTSEGTHSMSNGTRTGRKRRVEAYFLPPSKARTYMKMVKMSR